MRRLFGWMQHVPSVALRRPLPTYLCSRLKQGEKPQQVEPVLVLVRPGLQPVNIVVYIPTDTLYESPKPLEAKPSPFSFWLWPTWMWQRTFNIKFPAWLFDQTWIRLKPQSDPPTGAEWIWKSKFRLEESSFQGRSQEREPEPREPSSPDREVCRLWRFSICKVWRWSLQSSDGGSQGLVFTLFPLWMFELPAAW